MSLERLKKEIQGGTLSGIYAFSGAEDYLKRYYVDLVRSRVVPDADDPLNFLRLYYREASAAQILDFAAALPVFAEKKMLLLELTDSDPPSASLTEAIGSLCADFPQDCVIVVNEQKTDSPNKKSALQELVNAAKGRVLCVRFDERPQEELIRWVERHAQAAGKAMDRRTILHLLQVADHGMHSLRNELAKIFAHSGAAVTSADVDAVTVRTVESRIFDLADALFKNDPGAAVGLLRELLERYPETQVFDTVYGTFARLYRVSAASAAGLAPDDIAKSLGIKPYAVTKNLSLAGRVPAGTLRRVLKVCSDTDGFVKRASRDKALTAEVFVLRVADILHAAPPGRGGRASRPS